jgi:ParB family chromosome partitioning protein
MARKGKSGLGRGLDSLLGEVRQDVATVPSQDGNASDIAPSPRDVVRLPIGEIRPHPDQPRRQFSEEALGELADSIATRGVIQPIIVRAKDGGYQIVAGERRWRAAQKAQLHEIPAIVRDFDDGEALEIALIENIQREDLNPLEEAAAYQRLIDEFGHKQAELARLVDKSRSHVANLLRLLDLPGSVREMLLAGELSMGHARALVPLENAEEIAREVVARDLSVREVEELVRSASIDDEAADRQPPSTAPPPPSSRRERDPDIVALERHIGDLLGLRVAIEVDPSTGEAGTLTLGYRSLYQLDMLCQRLTGEHF